MNYKILFHYFPGFTGTETTRDADMTSLLTRERKYFLVLSRFCINIHSIGYRIKSYSTIFQLYGDRFDEYLPQNVRNYVIGEKVFKVPNLSNKKI